jgi:ribosomal protein S18 acetylase RimI-like enzyme
MWGVMQPTIRDATPQDARAIAAIGVDGWRVGYRGLVPDEDLAGISLDGREARWAEILAGDASWTFVAEVGGEVAAFCSVARPSRDEDAGPRTAEIAALYVAPERWRTGLGSVLLDAAIAELEAGPWTEVTLWVFAANLRGRAFYDAHGFDVADEAVNEHTGLPVVRLRRRLG